MSNCSEGYKKATEGRNWKTAGDDVQYEVVSTDKERVTEIEVFYQCSQSKRDWQHNLDFIPIRIKILGGDKIWVFRGLWKAFISAWPTVYQEIMNCTKAGKTYRVSFAGHSFGGAMSIFSALMMERMAHKPNKETCMGTVTVMTWGAPKVLLGKKALLELYSRTKGIQFACHNDLIARMPPFYPRYKQTMFVGEKFNLWKALTKGDHYHTCYGEIEE